MPVLTQADTLQIQMGYAYNIPMFADLGVSQPWSSFGQATVDQCSLQSASVFGAYSIVCFRDHFVRIRTPNNPANSAQISAVQLRAGGLFGLTWQDVNTVGTDKILRAQNMGVPSGSPLTLSKPLTKTSQGFRNITNSTCVGIHRYGWSYGQPLLGSWRCASLTPDHFECWLSDGSMFTVAAAGTSTLRMNDWFDYPRGVVVPYQNGYICQVQRSSQQRYIYFGGSEAAFREENVSLDDPTADALFQGVNNTIGQRTAAGSSGWIIDLGPGTGIFPNQGKRFIFISKLTNTWRDIQLIAMDATANARISNAGSEAFMITQSELDGLFYGKCDDSSTDSDQILVSPLPPKQILPLLAPMHGLPHYGIYDQPYGVQR